MINYLRIMMEVSSIFLIVSGTKEHLAKKKHSGSMLRIRMKCFTRSYDTVFWAGLLISLHLQEDGYLSRDTR